MLHQKSVVIRTEFEQSAHEFCGTQMNCLCFIRFLAYINIGRTYVTAALKLSMVIVVPRSADVKARTCFFLWQLPPFILVLALLKHRSRHNYKFGLV